MPTPPLPVLNALLSLLGLGSIQPASLRSVTPTLLLLVLESLLGRRLALAPRLRRPTTRADEHALAQVVLGSIAGDVLALDLSVVDPARVCQGHTPDIAVVIMALAVIARRRGLPLRLPSEEPEADENEDGDTSLLEDEDSVRALSADHEPLQPSHWVSPDMYATPPQAIASLPSPARRKEEYEEEYSVFDPLYGADAASHSPTPPSLAPPSPPQSVSSASTRSRSSYRARRQTVLEHMIEEFGLDPV